jgi:cell division septation protein DedD
VPKPTSSFASLWFVLLLAGTAFGQQRSTLEQVEAQIKAGQLEQARTLLERWRKDHASATPASDDGARATYLAAKLATDGSEAEDLYLSIAISAPASNQYVPESLLRVGQAELQNGSSRNAIPYFKRLIDSYPKSEFTTTASEWLKRAQSTDSTRVVARQPPRAPAQAPPAAVAHNESAARFTIQVAAFREKSNARSVLRALEKAGFSGVRVITVPDNSLLRVRVGHFTDPHAADAVLSKLKQAGYKAVVVADATRESAVRD